MKINSSKVWAFCFAFVLLIVTFFMTQHLVSANTERTHPLPETTHHDPDVSIIWQKNAGYQAGVTAYGASKPHYEITLSAQVAGHINTLSPQFEKGNRVSAGEWLIKLENSDYLAAVAEAQQDLDTAQVSLLEEQRQAQQALSEWTSSGLAGNPDSELVLRDPQITAAESLVNQTKARLNSAEKDLSNTIISAPFNAIIVERTVSPGSFVQTGSTVASLYSTDWVEVEVSLSAQEWQKLPDQQILTNGQWPVTLSSVEDGTTWSGVVIRTGQHIDQDTRQRSLIIAVEHPFEQLIPLYPGTFVQAEVEGKHLENLWQLPSSALSQRGEIWFVRDDNTLDNFSTQSMFNRDDKVYVDVPSDLMNQKVAVVAHPLNSYLKGMKVNPVEVEYE